MLKILGSQDFYLDQKQNPQPLAVVDLHGGGEGS
jgi:hypothetical protein